MSHGRRLVEEFRIWSASRRKLEEEKDKKPFSLRWVAAAVYVAVAPASKKSRKPPTINVKVARKVDDAKYSVGKALSRGSLAGLVKKATDGLLADTVAVILAAKDIKLEDSCSEFYFLHGEIGPNTVINSDEAATRHEKCSLRNLSVETDPHVLMAATGLKAEAEAAGGAWNCLSPILRFVSSEYFLVFNSFWDDDFGMTAPQFIDELDFRPCNFISTLNDYTELNDIGEMLGREEATAVGFWNGTLERKGPRAKHVIPISMLRCVCNLKRRRIRNRSALDRELQQLMLWDFSQGRVPYPSQLVCKQSDNSWQSLPTHSIRPAIKKRCVSIFIDMAKDAETSKPKHLDPTSEYYLSSQANSGASIITYYMKLLGMWDELLTLSPLESCGCPKGTEKMNWYQDLQTYQFLMGLDDKYTTLRTQIINMDPFPNIDRVYAMVMQEVSHQGIIGSRDTTSAVGFHAQNGPPTARSSGLVSATAGDPDRTPTGRPWCTFCHRVGHTQEKCYRRLGIAPPGKGRGRGRGSPAMSQKQSAPHLAHSRPLPPRHRTTTLLSARHKLPPLPLFRA
ncbi:hypothetical protein RJ639_021814 [Escallonia herrerae]|uniref:Uncharacterized protein n=1 Tax=Escallonia herrerae TaxID=1293975 RepID=A0AA89AEW3_9ASTE|nr:hypothetical protein RJ639_021814 [Escallonia herrerae]